MRGRGSKYLEGVGVLCGEVWVWHACSRILCFASVDGERCVVHVVLYDGISLRYEVCRDANIQVVEVGICNCCRVGLRSAVVVAQVLELFLYLKDGWLEGECKNGGRQ